MYFLEMNLCIKRTFQLIPLTSYESTMFHAGALSYHNNKEMNFMALHHGKFMAQTELLDLHRLKWWLSHDSYHTEAMKALNTNSNTTKLILKPPTVENKSTKAAMMWSCTYTCECEVEPTLNTTSISNFVSCGTTYPTSNCGHIREVALFCKNAWLSLHTKYCTGNIG